jgi:hypothetical protein
MIIDTRPHRFPGKRWDFLSNEMDAMMMTDVVQYIEPSHKSIVAEGRIGCLGR